MILLALPLMAGATLSKLLFLGGFKPIGDSNPCLSKDNDFVGSTIDGRSYNREASFVRGLKPLGDSNPCFAKDNDDFLGSTINGRSFS